MWCPEERSMSTRRAAVSSAGSTVQTRDAIATTSPEELPTSTSRAVFSSAGSTVPTTSAIAIPAPEQERSTSTPLASTAGATEISAADSTGAGIPNIMDSHLFKLLMDFMYINGSNYKTFPMPILQFMWEIVKHYQEHGGQGDRSNALRAAHNLYLFTSVTFPFTKPNWMTLRNNLNSMTAKANNKLCLVNKDGTFELPPTEKMHDIVTAFLVTENMIIPGQKLTPNLMLRVHQGLKTKGSILINQEGALNFLIADHDQTIALVNSDPFQKFLRESTLDAQIAAQQAKEAAQPGYDADRSIHGVESNWGAWGGDSSSTIASQSVFPSTPGVTPRRRGGRLPTGTPSRLQARLALIQEKKAAAKEESNAILEETKKNNANNAQGLKNNALGLKNVEDSNKNLAKVADTMNEFSKLELNASLEVLDEEYDHLEEAYLDPGPPTNISFPMMAAVGTVGTVGTNRSVAFAADLLEDLSAVGTVGTTRSVAFAADVVEDSSVVVEDSSVGTVGTNRSVAAFAADVVDGTNGTGGANGTVGTNRSVAFADVVEVQSFGVTHVDPMSVLFQAIDLVGPSESVAKPSQPKPVAETATTKTQVKAAVKPIQPKSVAETTSIKMSAQSVGKGRSKTPSKADNMPSSPVSSTSRYARRNRTPSSKAKQNSQMEKEKENGKKNSKKNGKK